MRGDEAGPGAGCWEQRPCSQLPLPLHGQVRFLKLYIPAQASFPYLTRQLAFKKQNQTKSSSSGTMILCRAADSFLPTPPLHMTMQNSRRPAGQLSWQLQPPHPAPPPEPLAHQRHANPHSRLSCPAVLPGYGQSLEKKGKLHP